MRRQAAPYSMRYAKEARRHGVSNYVRVLPQYSVTALRCRARVISGDMPSCCYVTAKRRERDGYAAAVTAMMMPRAACHYASRSTPRRGAGEGFTRYVVEVGAGAIREKCYGYELRQRGFTRGVCAAVFRCRYASAAMRGGVIEEIVAFRLVCPLSPSSCRCAAVVVMPPQAPDGQRCRREPARALLPTRCRAKPRYTSYAATRSNMLRHDESRQRRAR